MSKLQKTVKQGMLHRVVSPIDDKLFQADYPIQYQLDVMRKAILNQPKMVELLKKMEEARYGLPKN